MGRRLFGDIESDGLMEAIPSRGIKKNTKVHCLGHIDLDTGEERYFGPAFQREDLPLRCQADWTPLYANPSGTLEDGYREWEEADLLLAHNGIGYDYRALEYLVPGWKRPAKAWDTLSICKVVWPVDILLGPDLGLAAKHNMDGKTKMAFIKRHSLKAWGIRLGILKDEYEGGFEAWCPEMSVYMMQDNRVGVALWKLIEKRTGQVEPEKADLVWPAAVFEVECEVARILQEQEEDGIKFDMDRAQALAAHLSTTRSQLEQGLVDTFGSWWAAGAVTTPAADRSVLTEVLSEEWSCKDVTVKRYGKDQVRDGVRTRGKELAPYVGPPKTHYSVDAPFTPVVRTKFNPGSRDHLGQRLQAVFGWKPKVFGKNGKPTVDESVLEEIPEAVMPVETRKLILDYFVVTKTLAMVANGSKAWIHLATDASRIHGRVDPSGAVTGRATHSNPNLSQVPSVTKEKAVVDGVKQEVILRGLAGRFGYECRELFRADDGWEQTGVDASALELIDLGHYLFPLDGGAFSARVCDPSRDPHQEHADLANLTRGDAKTATYLYVYGGSAYKLSLDLELLPEDDILELLSYRGLTGLLRGLALRFDQEFVDKMDDKQKAKLVKARKIIVAFEGGIDGIKDLKADLTAVAKGRGWLRAMDGRKLFVRKPHAALNTLLQSAGAQTCKLWMMLVHQKLNALGLYRHTDFKQVLWVHDELQFTHRPGLGPIIKQVAEEAMQEAGVRLGLRGRYRTDGKTGRNWAECH